VMGEGAGILLLESLSHARYVLPVICRWIDGGVIGSIMGLFLIGGHWPKILPQN
jgi:hypothetical protein